MRPKGARLKTFGGRASGPEPLESLFLFAVQLFQRARGRHLTPLECHDLVCKIAEVVVVGGVRRCAAGREGGQQLHTHTTMPARVGASWPAGVACILHCTHVSRCRRAAALP